MWRSMVMIRAGSMEIRAICPPLAFLFYNNWGPHINVLFSWGPHPGFRTTRQTEKPGISHLKRAIPFSFSVRPVLWTASGLARVFCAWRESAQRVLASASWALKPSALRSKSPSTLSPPKFRIWRTRFFLSLSQAARKTMCGGAVCESGHGMAPADLPVLECPLQLFARVEFGARQDLLHSLP